MNKLTRKITLSLVAILFAVLALGTTTYAWFTLGTTATVESVSADVTTGEGIEISLDGKNWYTTLSKDAVANWIKTNAANVKLQDLAKEKGNVKFVTSQGEDASKSSYLKLPIKIRAIGDSVNKAVKVSKVAITSVNAANENSTNPILWTADVSLDGVWVAGQKYTYYAEDAARVTFVYNDSVKLTAYHDDTTSDKATENPGVADSAAASTNGTRTSTYANLKGFDISTDVYKDGLVSKYADDEPYLEDSKVSDTVVIPADTLTTAGVKVDVYIWLNGFDDDCINAILNGNISVSFAFTVAE